MSTGQIIKSPGTLCHCLVFQCVQNPRALTATLQACTLLSWDQTRPPVHYYICNNNLVIFHYIIGNKLFYYLNQSDSLTVLVMHIVHLQWVIHLSANDHKSPDIVPLHSTHYCYKHETTNEWFVELGCSICHR